MMKSEVCGVPVAPMVRTQVLCSQERFWCSGDFDGSRSAVTQALVRLTNAGELRRVRRGLYWRGEPTPLGMAPPTNDQLISEIAPAAGVGPAGWSAALALMLSTQVPRYDTIAVQGRAPKNVGSLRFVSRAASVGRRLERLHPIEVALFEVLRAWDDVVELPFDVAAERVDSLFDEGALRLDRIVRASMTEPIHVRERLAQLFETVGHMDSAARVRPST